MTRYYYDCEFLDTGTAIDLISIGIVCEDGRELYLQSSEFDPSKASLWVRENVFPHLKKCSTNWPIDGAHHVIGQCRRSDCVWRRHAQIAHAVEVFMDVEKDGKPELWSYYGAYDHVAFCQLFGTMMDLPPGYPYLTYDLRQWLDMNGLQDVRQPDDSPHNSLLDARWVAQTYKFCSNWMRERKNYLENH